MSNNAKRITDFVAGLAAGGWFFWWLTRFQAIPRMFTQGLLEGPEAFMAFDIADDTLMPIFILVPLTLVAIILQIRREA